MSSKQELELVKPGIVDLAISIDDLKKKADEFKELKKKLLTENDYVDIGKKKYIKKSGIFQFALAFNLKTEIIVQEKETDDKKPDWYAYHFTVRCIAPNGRITEKVGSCSNDEKDNDGKPLHQTVHKVRSMAETRASNRAVSAMVGSAEVTAEEMQGMKDDIAKNGNGKKYAKYDGKYCACETPKPKFVVQEEFGLHFCATCNCPVTQETAIKSGLEK